MIVEPTHSIATRNAPRKNARRTELVAQHFSGLGIDQVNPAAERAGHRLIGILARGILGDEILYVALHLVARGRALKEKSRHFDLLDRFFRVRLDVAQRPQAARRGRPNRGSD